ncbi:c-type cytochrome [Luteitalea sp.]|jgi:mono/diheme cytochrome c family protein|uniref:c-type cytochrome n=1 Tax=Luteitalea sp. TaxID=2004800 RepID=UPI0037C57345
MTPLRAWIVRIVLLGLGSAGLASAAVWLASERRLHATETWPQPVLDAVPADEATVREGERLGRILGCPSCHGPAMAGAPVRDARTGLDLAAPNLTRVRHAYTNDALARAIRAGVDRDGRALYGMPARDFRHLSDEDVRRVIAWLRALPERADALARRGPGVGARLRLLVGRAVPDALAVGPVTPSSSEPDAATRGRYLAHVACGECHGATLEGDGARVPPLTVAVAYTEAAFAHLMRTGETPGGRDLTVMDDTARARFTHFTDEEIASLYAYLRQRAGQ